MRVSIVIRPALTYGLNLSISHLVLHRTLSVSLKLPILTVSSSCVMLWYIFNSSVHFNPWTWNTVIRKHRISPRTLLSHFDQYELIVSIRVCSFDNSIYLIIWMVPVSSWSKARMVLDRPNIRIMGWNPFRDMDAYPCFSVLCCPV
jgi:hypothetical protein